MTKKHVFSSFLVPTEEAAIAADGTFTEPLDASIVPVAPPQVQPPKKASKMAKKLESDLQDYVEMIFQIENERSGNLYLDPSFVQAHRMKMYTVNEVYSAGEEEEGHSSIDFESHNNIGQYSIEKSSTAMSAFGESDHEKATPKNNPTQKNSSAYDQKSFEERDPSKTTVNAGQSQMMKPKSSSTISKIQETIKMMNSIPRASDIKNSAMTTGKKSVNMENKGYKESLIDKRIAKANSAAESQSQDSQEQLHASQVLLNSISDSSQQTMQKYDIPPASKGRGSHGAPIFDSFVASTFNPTNPGRLTPAAKQNPALHRERPDQGSSKTLWAEPMPGMDYYSNRMIPQPGYPMPFGFFDPHYMSSLHQAGYPYPPPDMSRYGPEWTSDMYHRYGPMHYPPGYMQHPMHPQMNWYNHDFGAEAAEANYSSQARMGKPPSRGTNPTTKDLKTPLQQPSAQRKDYLERKPATLTKPPTRTAKIIEPPRSRQGSSAQSPHRDRNIPQTDRNMPSSRNTSQRGSAAKLPRCETPTKQSVKTLTLNPKPGKPAVESKSKQTTASMATSVLGGTKTNLTPKKGFSSLYNRLDTMRMRPGFDPSAPILTGASQPSLNSHKPGQLVGPKATRVIPAPETAKRGELSGVKDILKSRTHSQSMEKLLSNALGRSPKYLTSKDPQTSRTDHLSRTTMGQTQSRGSSRSETPQKQVGRFK